MKKLLIIFSIIFSINATAAEKVVSDGLSLPVSKESIDTIIYYEVGGRSYYNSNLTKPTVPAWKTTSSGVTIGFGFDCGYNTKEEIEKATKNILSKEEIEALQKISGLKGKEAYYKGLPQVKYTVNVSYEEAEKIFRRDSLPRFTKLTKDAFVLTPNRLHPHCNGALTSLVFNRGASMSKSSSRNEMRSIRYNISISREDKVPSDIRAMKRLWSYSALKGLHLRRDAEAALFQKGLDEKR